MPKDLRAEELRDAARFLERSTLDALTSYTELDFSLVVGDLQNFPRPSPHDRAVERGFDVLRDQIEGATAALNAVAAAIENNLEVPPVLLVALQPYIAAFREAQAERGSKPRVAVTSEYDDEAEDDEDDYGAADEPGSSGEQQRGDGVGKARPPKKRSRGAGRKGKR